MQREDFHQHEVILHLLKNKPLFYASTVRCEENRQERPNQRENTGSHRPVL